VGLNLEQAEEGGEHVDRHNTELRAGGLQDDWHLKLRTNRGQGDCRAKESCLTKTGKAICLMHVGLGAALFGPNAGVLSDQTPRGFSTEITIFRKFHVGISSAKGYQGSQIEVGITVFWSM
jgi:hypothetical protein